MVVESHETTPEQPFFADPEYWDGHVFGDTGAQHQDIARYGWLERNGASLALLLRFADLGANPNPVDIYGAGQRFDIDSASPGTMLLFNLETVSMSKKVDLALESITQKLPSRPWPPVKGRLPQDHLEEVALAAENPRGIIGLHNGLKYRWDNYWGVVRPRRGENRVHALSSRHVAASGLNNTLEPGKRAPKLAVYPASCFREIGRVSTYSREGQEGDVIDLMRRICRLEMYQPSEDVSGRRRRTASSLGQIAAHYSPGGAAIA